MAKNKKKTSQKTSPLSKVLFSTNKEKQMRVKFFSSLSAKEIYRSIPSIKDHRFFKEITSLNRNVSFPKMYSGACPATDLEKSIYWSIGVIETNKDKIHQFICQEKLLTRMLLASEYDECLKILDQIDDLLGISLWSITLRGTVLSLIGDHDLKVEYIKHLDSISEKNSFLSAVIGSLSQRHVDYDVFIPNAKSFTSQIKRSFDGSLLHILLYRLTVRDYLEPLDYEVIFNSEKGNSLVDLYNCIISYLGHKVTLGHNFDDSDRFAVSVLFKNCQLPSVANLAHSMGLSSDWKFDSEEFEFIELYTKGGYDEIISTLFDSTFKYDEFQYYEIVAKASTRTPIPSDHSLKSKIIEALVDVMKINDKWHTSLSFLLCLCYSLQPLRWFSELHLFLIREVKAISERDNNHLRDLSIILSSFNSPKKLLILPPELRKKYIYDYKQSFPSSLTLFLFENQASMHKAKANATKSIEKQRLQKYACRSLMESGQHELAIPLLAVLADSTDTLISYEASSMLVDSYIEVDQPELALEQFVKKCVHNQSLVRIYNTDVICNAAKIIAKLSKSIYVPIAICLHSQFIDDTYDSVLRFSFERFLLNNSVELPLDDHSIYAEYPVAVSQFFLEYACVPDVMKLYFNLPTSRSIEECRIGICNYLIECYVSKEKLKHEVIDRTKKLVIGTAYNQIEKSRIYSDVSVFSSEAVNNRYSNLYDKYISLKKIDYSNHDDEKSLKEIYELFKGKDLLQAAHTLYLLELPLNEKNSTFLTLLRRMRDEFAFGDKGFNYYLSTRIRHGHLPNMLRKGVLDENLVTKKVTSASHFKPNEFWLERLRSADPKVMDRLERAFSDFTAKYEEEINIINDKWLQITTLDQAIINLSDTKSKSEAIFDFSIGNFESYAIQRRIPESADYSEFAKHVIDWLWQRADINLSKARERLSSAARQRFLHLLHTLQKEVFDLCSDSSGLSLFNDAIGRSRACLNNYLEQIIAWFVRSEGAIVSFYDIDIAIEIATKSAFGNVAVSKDRTYVFAGASLGYFVDVFYILFENAISKAQLPKDQLDLKLDITSTSTEISFLVQNRCTSVSDVAIANQRLEYYRSNYGNKAVKREDLQGEGGTGFFKIHNILKNLLDLDHTISFGYVTHDLFEVNICLKDITKVEHHENIDS